MKLYIPSRARSATEFIHGPNSTLNWIKGTNLAARTFYCVRSDEVAAYEKSLAGSGVRILDVGLTQNLGEKRVVIAETVRAAGEEKFLMCDDDVRLCVRKASDAYHMRYADPGEVEFLIAQMEQLLDTYAQIGVSAREGNNRAGNGPFPLLRENTRAMRMYAFRTADYLAIDGNRLPDMEDLDTVLQLLRSGRKNAVLFYYAQGHVSSNSPGGCSLYRSAETHDAVCQQLQQLHPEFVTLRRKVSKTDQNGFGQRTEVTVQWQRAYASSVGASSQASAAVPAEHNPGNWWWDASWNTSGGCRGNSPGCQNCFAPARAGTLHQQSGVSRRVDTLYAGTIRQTKDGRYVFNGRQTAQPSGHDSWTWPLRWPGAKHPLLGPGQPSLIFVSDMSDLFYERRPKSIIDRTLGTIVASNHIGLVCTRRAERMAQYFAALPASALPRWQAHMWLGFSAENQEWFDSRWPLVRPLTERGWMTFVSIAPMIGPVTLPPDFLSFGSKVWAICSGEQRCPGVPRERIRHMHLNWARAIRDQCAPADVAFFMKQNSKKGPIPPDLHIRQLPRLCGNFP